jgi:hypothetical protein
MDLHLGSTQALIDECRRQQLLRNQCAYVLATAFWETARKMVPVREMGGEKYLKSKKYYPYVGMGFVQLTWLANYEKASKILGVDFVKNPKLLLEPKYAIPICVTGMREGWFTGKKLSDYITLAKSDFVNARRIINGKDKAAQIAKLAREYDMDLKVTGYGEGKPGSVSASIPVPKPPTVHVATPAAPQEAEKPHVVLMDGPKKDETTVVVVKTPQNVAQTNPVPTSKTGFAVLGAMAVAVGAAALKYFGG